MGDVVHLKRKKIDINIIFIIINVIIYSLAAYLGNTTTYISTDTLIKLGANLPELTIDNGEMFRVIAAIFLNIDIMDLIVSSAALYIFGSILLKNYTWYEYIVIYVVAGICTSLYSVYGLQKSLVSVSSMGSVFGIAIVTIVYIMTNKLYKDKSVVVKSAITVIVLVLSNLISYGEYISICVSGIIGGIIALILVSIGIGKVIKFTLIGFAIFLVINIKIPVSIFQDAYHKITSISDNIQYNKEDDILHSVDIIMENGTSNGIKLGKSYKNSMEIVFEENKLIMNNIPKDNNFKYIWVQFVNIETGNNYECDVKERRGKENHYIKLSMPNLNEGKYYINICASNEKYSTYKYFLYNSLIGIKSDNEFKVEISPVYEHNMGMMGNTEVLNTYLKAEIGIQSDNKDIIELADNITNGIENDYEKALAIHDWVAQNIYYDMDSYRNGAYRNTQGGASGALMSRKAVCQGYAELTAALIRAVNIPCKFVTGYALGISEEGNWTKNNINVMESNHAWNEVYVNNRWMIIDTTWDSPNVYENGQLKKDDNISWKYFDPTVELFSTTHKILNNKIEEYVVTRALSYEESSQLAMDVYLRVNPEMKTINAWQDGGYPIEFEGMTGYHIQLFEDKPERIVTVAWYFVDINTGKVYSTLATCPPITLLN